MKVCKLRALLADALQFVECVRTGKGPNYKWSNDMVRELKRGIAELDCLNKCKKKKKKKEK